MTRLPARSVLALLALALPLLASALAGQAVAPDTTRLEVAGLRAPVEIITDRWGVPHIYAETEADLFFAQGWNAARDRLFQFELWRRQATGTVAEILGPRELERDIGTRLFMFRGDLEEELNHYHPRGGAIIGAFVRGVNAWIAETERDPSLLPLRGVGGRPVLPGVLHAREDRIGGRCRDAAGARALSPRVARL